MILFLDFDGVPPGQLQNGPDFLLHGTVVGNPDLRAYPNVNVVFSTSWREIYRPDELVKFVTSGGSKDLTHRFAGQTRGLTITNAPTWRLAGLPRNRSWLF